MLRLILKETNLYQNWEEHKQKIDDMYHIDRECTDLTNCEKGTYTTEMVMKIIRN